MKQDNEASSDRTKPYPGDSFPEKSCGAAHYDSPVAAIAGRRKLLRKDMGVLMDSVREGRKTFLNTLKYTMMATSSHSATCCRWRAAFRFCPSCRCSRSRFYPGPSSPRSPVGACSLVSSLLLVRATMSQDSSLTQSGHSVRQALTAYSGWLVWRFDSPNAACSGTSGQSASAHRSMIWSMSAPGPFRTCRNVRLESVMRAIADI